VPAPTEPYGALDAAGERRRLCLFDAYIFADWSGASARGREGDDDTIWYAVADEHLQPQAVFCPTRHNCIVLLEEVLQQMTLAL